MEPSHWAKQTKQIKVTTIQAYAPTEDSEDTIKDNLYNQLQTTLDETSTHDLILLMGDFNAKINPNRTGFEYVMGPYGSAENISDNGERMISLCAFNSLSNGNTYFKHKQIHKNNMAITKWRNLQRDRLHLHLQTMEVISVRRADPQKSGNRLRPLPCQWQM
uniref:Endonuclease/exonuclease/phosphatase domain-containing protein n=1 Tax=Biomphalaria glabrata TaxID=6526 RepID=A0A2C9LJJ7_BIOGL